MFKRKIALLTAMLIAICSMAGCGSKNASKTDNAVNDTNDEAVSGDVTSDASAELEVTEPDLSMGFRLNYPQLDISSLDNTAIGWGMGPDRDDKNRPITALQYQDEYKDYNVDFIVPSEDKNIYLTFDEGYENGYTPTILDTLNEHNATGIFFVTKHYLDTDPDLIQRMIDEGHIVGNHTIHHPSDGMQAHDVDYQTNEVKEMHELIKDKFGYSMYLFRYPTGMFSKQSLAIVSNCGYRSVFWSFAYKDWDPANQMSHADALLQLEEKLHPGAIYLIHAVSETNAAVLDDFLTYAEDQGYSFGDYSETLDKDIIIAEDDSEDQPDEK